MEARTNLTFNEKLSQYLNAKESIELAVIPESTYIYIDGKFDNEYVYNKEFFEAIDALLQLTGALRKHHDPENTWGVAPLECLYKPQNEWPEDADPDLIWHWRLMMMIPDEISDRDIFFAIKEIELEQGKSTMLRNSRSWRYNPGLCIQKLFRGSWDEKEEVVQQLYDYALRNGYKISGPRHEIYLSGLSKNMDKNTSIIIRFPVKK